MSPSWTQLGYLIETRIDCVQFPTEITPHVEPPVTHKVRLTELRPVGAQKRGLTTVDVTIVPGLATGLRVGEEAGVGLVVAVEVGVGDHGQDGVVRAGATWYGFA
uniref:Uncharacterized protein n=1 Tax=Cacopsylla melanoneura TaxID=428564 RepID=A0A8D8WGB3_9HEMI